MLVPQLGRRPVTPSHRLQSRLREVREFLVRELEEVQEEVLVSLASYNPP